jgi:DegV family protein with EDD domain
MGAKRIALVTDSTAYLPPEVLERLDVPVIPLNVIWGDQVLKDGVDILPNAFYERLSTDEVMPTTSQPSAGEFVDFFQQVAEEKRVDSIVGFFISSELSGTVASAEAAKGLLPDLQIEVVDSRSTSMGLGFQVMEAAEVAQSGGSMSEILEAARRLRYRSQLLFVVNTLEFLHRGGRIGGARRLLGTALKIKPLLELEEGKIESLDQVRTKKKALARMFEVGQERRGSDPVARAALLHANAAEECLALQEELQSCLEPREIFVTGVSPVVGTHTGPGTLGMAFYTQ